MDIGLMALSGFVTILAVLVCIYLWSGKSKEKQAKVDDLSSVEDIQEIVIQFKDGRKYQYVDILSLTAMAVTQKPPPEDVFTSDFPVVVSFSLANISFQYEITFRAKTLNYEI